MSISCSACGTHHSPCRCSSSGRTFSKYSKYEYPDLYIESNEFGYCEHLDFHICKNLQLSKTKTWWHYGISIQWTLNYNQGLKIRQHCRLSFNVSCAGITGLHTVIKISMKRFGSCFYAIWILHMNVLIPIRSETIQWTLVWLPDQTPIPPKNTTVAARGC